MAGDTLRDAFRADLDAVILAASPAIPWRRRDLTNTGTAATLPAANAAADSQGWFEIEFLPSAEAQYTFGAGSYDLHRELGQVTIRVVTRLNAGSTVRDLAEVYLGQIRTAYRKRRIGSGIARIFIDRLLPMGDGFNEGGEWVASLAVEWHRFNEG